MIISKSEAERFLGKRLKGLGAGNRAYYALSADGTRNLDGPYTRPQALERLGQVEYFKRNPSKSTIVTVTLMSPLDEIALIGNPELYILPNESARKIARQALKKRKELPKYKRGGLDPIEAHEEGVGSGVLRARDIANGKRVDAYRVKSFFDRHRGNYVKARSDGKAWEDSKILQAWDLWGGEPMRRQANAAVIKSKRARNPKSELSLSQARKIVKKAVRERFHAPQFGGIADGMSVHDFEPNSLAHGILVEIEHTNNPLFAMRIAMDHLAEDDEYYKKLKAVEAGPGPYKLTKTKLNPKPFESRPHDWGQILIDRPGKRLTRKQILDYYKHNENKIWPFLKGQTVMVILAPGRNEFVRRRHNAGNTFIKLTKRKGIDDPSSFEYWIHRRVVEFHPTLISKTTPILWLDLDIHTTKDPKARKKLLTAMNGAVPIFKKIFKEMGVRKVLVYTSGTDGGLHFEGNLDKAKDIDTLRRRFTKRLSEVFGDSETFTVGIAKPGQIRMDTTTLHKLGSLRAPYSMTVTGEVKRPIGG